MKTPLWYPLLGVAVLVLACRGSASAVEDAKTFFHCTSYWQACLTRRWTGSTLYHFIQSRRLMQKCCRLSESIGAQKDPPGTQCAGHT
jgi:hypothetical protein